MKTRCPICVGSGIVFEEMAEGEVEIDEIS